MTIKNDNHLKELIQEQVLVAIALHPYREWDEWANGLCLILCSELPKNFESVKVKKMISETLWEHFLRGCCNKQKELVMSNKEQVEVNVEDAVVNARKNRQENPTEAKAFVTGDIVAANTTEETDEEN
jgi:hypothetical protein